MVYAVKGSGKTKTYIKITRERIDGYEIRITSEGENFRTDTEDFLPKSLFESCVRTGYLEDIGT